jgi:transcriptional regulator with XRE-family HTH domain
LGAWIVKLRKSKGVAPAELGRNADIERSNMAAIEGGRVNVTFHTLVRIANGLDMTLEEFFKGFEG